MSDWRGRELGLLKDWNLADWFRYSIDVNDPTVVAAWHGWFAAHGVDPVPVLLSEWVERRASDAENAIVWLEAGVRDGEPITVHCEKQLEAPPLPFPPL